MYDLTGLSQRRACRLTGLSLSTCRYKAQHPSSDVYLSGRNTELAIERASRQEMKALDIRKQNLHLYYGDA